MLRLLSLCITGVGVASLRAMDTAHVAWYTVPAIILCLLALITILFSTLKTGISPMPSSGKARREILQQLSDRLPVSEQTLIDAGSGWGHLVIPLARRFPQHQVTGYELSWFPWLTSLLLKHLLRLDNLTLRRRDFLKADLSQANVIVCYLVPASMRALEDKLKADELEVPLLLSHYFALPSYQPQTVIYLEDWYRTPVYVYQSLTT